MRISIASDHAGIELKSYLNTELKKMGYAVEDYGTFSENSVDYPDFAFLAAQSIVKEKADLGILICGTGIGMSITANKIKGIRAANCFSVETAMLSRQHNNANVLTLGARITNQTDALKICEAFIKTEFEGERHIHRIQKIHQLTGC